MANLMEIDAKTLSKSGGRLRCVGRSNRMLGCLIEFPSPALGLPRRARPHLARLGNLIALMRNTIASVSFVMLLLMRGGGWPYCLHATLTPAEKSLKGMQVASDSKPHDSNQEKRPSMTESLSVSVIEDLMQNNIRWLDTLENQTTPRCAPSGTRRMS
ncbi:hypothetical protein E4U57_000468 [Claviceps arundinis]|uniref:Uncharacterized protein n=1 Tax=Claviceps arundinis TaxID=1623583 RepID=A0A9P7SMX5_9HYPO|nr:hypothetical protein E4U57_000468 [Claviceps arundinis]KAG5961611.1 hypothetical protein E4U56_003794 [Claviceps arundinis]